eukprot:6358391-Prymnesium_polylepis.2
MTPRHIVTSSQTDMGECIVQRVKLAFAPSLRSTALPMVELTESSTPIRPSVRCGRRTSPGYT